MAQIFSNRISGISSFVDPGDAVPKSSIDIVKQDIKTNLNLDQNSSSFLYVDSNNQVTGNSYRGVQVFTGVGIHTFTVPENASNFYIEVCGGGGGGPAPRNFCLNIGNSHQWGGTFNYTPGGFSGADDWGGSGVFGGGGHIYREGAAEFVNLAKTPGGTPGTYKAFLYTKDELKGATEFNIKVGAGGEGGKHFGICESTDALTWVPYKKPTPRMLKGSETVSLQYSRSPKASKRNVPAAAGYGMAFVGAFKDRVGAGNTIFFLNSRRGNAYDDEQADGTPPGWKTDRTQDTRPLDSRSGGIPKSVEYAHENNYGGMSVWANIDHHNNPTDRFIEVLGANAPGLYPIVYEQDTDLYDASQGYYWDRNNDMITSYENALRPVDMEYFGGKYWVIADTNRLDVIRNRITNAAVTLASNNHIKGYGVGRQRIYTSTDIIHWDKTRIGSHAPKSKGLPYDCGQWVIDPSDPNYNNVLNSNSAYPFSNVLLDDTHFSAYTFIKNDGNGRLWIGAEDGVLGSTTDGILWEIAPTGIEARLNTSTSYNSFLWSYQAANQGLLNKFTTLSYGNGVYVTCFHRQTGFSGSAKASSKGGYILTSTDTINWTLRTSSVLKTTWESGFSAGVTVESGKIKESANLQSQQYTGRLELTLAHYTSLFENGEFLFGQRYLESSTDGIVWVARTCPVWVNKLRYENNTYFAAGQSVDGTGTPALASSTDSVVWQLLTTPFRPSTSDKRIREGITDIIYSPTDSKYFLLGTGFGQGRGGESSIVSWTQSDSTEVKLKSAGGDHSDPLLQDTRHYLYGDNVEEVLINRKHHISFTGIGTYSQDLEDLGTNEVFDIKSIRMIGSSYNSEAQAIDNTGRLIHKIILELKQDIQAGFSRLGRGLLVGSEVEIRGLLPNSFNKKYRVLEYYGSKADAYTGQTYALDISNYNQIILESDTPFEDLEVTSTVGATLVFVRNRNLIRGVQATAERFECPLYLHKINVESDALSRVRNYYTMRDDDYQHEEIYSFNGLDAAHDQVSFFDQFDFSPTHGGGGGFYYGRGGSSLNRTYGKFKHNWKYQTTESNFGIVDIFEIDVFAGIGTTTVNSGVGTLASNYSMKGFDRGILSGLGTQAQDPNIVVNSGDILAFKVNIPGYPFYIKSALGIGSDYQLTTNVTNQGTDSGDVIWKIPHDTSGVFYYQSSVNSNMHGSITVNPESSDGNPGLSFVERPYGSGGGGGPAFYRGYRIWTVRTKFILPFDLYNEISSSSYKYLGNAKRQYSENIHKGSDANAIREVAGNSTKGFLCARYYWGTYPENHESTSNPTTIRPRLTLTTDFITWEIRTSPLNHGTSILGAENIARCKFVNDQYVILGEGQNSSGGYVSQMAFSTDAFVWSFRTVILNGATGTWITGDYYRPKESQYNSYPLIRRFNQTTNAIWDIVYGNGMYVAGTFRGLSAPGGYHDYPATIISTDSIVWTAGGKFEPYYSSDSTGHSDQYVRDRAKQPQRLNFNPYDEKFYACLGMNTAVRGWIWDWPRAQADNADTRKYLELVSSTDGIHWVKNLDPNTVDQAFNGDRAPLYVNATDPADSMHAPQLYDHTIGDGMHVVMQDSCEPIGIGTTTLVEGANSGGDKKTYMYVSTDAITWDKRDVSFIWTGYTTFSTQYYGSLPRYMRNSHDYRYEWANHVKKQVHYSEGRWFLFNTIGGHCYTSTDLITWEYSRWGAGTNDAQNLPVNQLVYSPDTDKYYAVGWQVYEMKKYHLDNKLEVMTSGKGGVGIAGGGGGGGANNLESYGEGGDGGDGYVRISWW